MEPASKVLLLSIGGALGVNARYWLGLGINRWLGEQFPWATLLINVSGSFAIGVLGVVLLRWFPHPNARLLMITGFLGGYTTFSTCAFEAATLWEQGETRRSLGYVIGSVAGGLVAVVLGIALGQALAVTGREISDRPGASNAVGEVEPGETRGGGPATFQDAEGHPERGAERNAR